jgi:polyisoprenoid-binding protein YceI
MSTIETIAPAGTWSADPVHSDVSFEVVHAGVDVFRGSFGEFSATLTGDALTGSAKVASVDVKDEQLSGHLLAPDFFDAARYPEISFSAAHLEREGNALTAKGELTIKGVTKPVELTGTISDPSVDPFGNERIGLTLEATIDRTDFGVSWNAPNQSGGDYLANDVKLVAELCVLIRVVV